MRPYRRRQERKIDHEGEALLGQIVTGSEACRMWRKNKNTIKIHILAGNLTGRMSGHIWLVTTKSLYEYYGEPIDPNLDY